MSPLLRTDRLPTTIFLQETCLLVLGCLGVVCFFGIARCLAKTTFKNKQAYWCRSPWWFDVISRWIVLLNPRDPITETENGFMEPKYYAFRRWLETPYHRLRKKLDAYKKHHFFKKNHPPKKKEWSSTYIRYPPQNAGSRKIWGFLK